MLLTGFPRTAAVTMLAGAILVLWAAPAPAAPPTINIESVSSENVASGESVRVRFRATNNGAGTETVFVAVSGGLRCTAGCSASPRIAPGRSRTFDATVVAPRVRAGEISGRNLAVSVRIGTATAFDHRMIHVHGGEQPAPTVRQISGRVGDTGGKAVGGADVIVTDSAGRNHQATTNRKGRFTIRSAAGRPIIPGRLTAVAGKNGYRIARASVQGAAGKTAAFRLTLAAEATPSSAPASPSASAEAVPLEAEPQPLTAPAESPAAQDTVSDEGDSSPLFTVLGGLLVAAGAGALLLVLIRRRQAS